MRRSAAGKRDSGSLSRADALAAGTREGREPGLLGRKDSDLSSILD